MQGNVGCIYWDESSRGAGVNGQKRRGRWVAEIMVDGKRKRMRSASRERCEAFLQGVREEQLPPRSVTVRADDPRYPLSYGRRVSMAVQEAKLDRRIKEAQLTKEYLRTRDFSAISRHLEQHVLPELSIICRKRDRCAKFLAEWVPSAVATMYIHLHADYAIVDYLGFLRKIIRRYKADGSCPGFDALPTPIHQEVEQLDLSCLATKWNVKCENRKHV